MNDMAIETLNSNAKFWMLELAIEFFLVFSTKNSSRYEKMGVAWNVFNHLMKSSHQSNDKKKLVICQKAFGHCPKISVANLGN
jgi:hypothetical protein